MKVNKLGRTVLGLAGCGLWLSPAWGGESVLSGRPVFSGNAVTDFKPGAAGTGDPDPRDLYTRVVEDNLEDGGGPELMLGSGKVSGYDINKLWVFYHPLYDVLYIGVETFGIAGDADGDGNPDASTTPGVSDYIQYGYYESIDVMIDVDHDGDNDEQDVPDYIFGKPSVRPPAASSLASHFRASSWVDYQQPFENLAEATQLPGVLPNKQDPQELTTTQSSTSPHVEFVINHVSSLPKLQAMGFDPYMDELHIRIAAYQGSENDTAKVGEDDVPAEDEDFLLVPMLDVLKFPSPVGSLSGKVTQEWPSGFEDRDGPVAGPVLNIKGNFDGSGVKTFQVVGNADGTYTTVGQPGLPNGGMLRMGDYTISLATDGIYKPLGDLQTTVGVQQAVTDLDFVLTPADDDGDYLLDAVEIELAEERGDADNDRDNDGTPDYEDTDSDGDGFSDTLEAHVVDVDGDGELDYVVDPVESADEDGDGMPNHLDVDSDNDGLTDDQENADGDTTSFDDTDGDKTPDIYDQDSDNDDILDGVEAGISTTAASPDSGEAYVGDADPTTQTDPDDADTDDDCIPDGVEDADHNGQLATWNTANWPTQTPETDPNQVDTDGDGLSDFTELGYVTGDFPETAEQTCADDADPDSTTDPRDPDTDGGSDLDGTEDINHNGEVDDGEIDPNYAPDDTDWDGDGVLDEDEDEAGTDWQDGDSDDDGIPDGDEDYIDSDGDGDINPLDPDSDDDGLQDGTEQGLTEPGMPEYTDLDIFIPDDDPQSTTDFLDDDTDDDGLLDGNEDANHDGMYASSSETDPNNPNTDDDCEQDGTELGLTAPQGVDTDMSLFEPDSSPETTSDPTVRDSVDCFAGLALGGGGLGSCSVAPTSRPSLGWFLALAPMLALLRRRSLRGSRPVRKAQGAVAGSIGLGLLATGGLLAVTTGQAQAADEAPAVETQQFHPSTDLSGAIMTSGSSIIPMGKLHFAAWMNYASQPLIFRYESGDADVLQDNVVGLEVTGAVALSKALQLGVSLPVTLFQQIDVSNPFMYDARSTTLNDISVQLRWRILDRARKGVGLAFEPRLTLPTGNPASLSGGQTLIGGVVAIDRMKRGRWVGLNLGYRHRFETATLGNLNIGPEAIYRIGLGFPARELYWTVDAFGAIGLASQDPLAIPEVAYANKPLEVMLGISRSFKRFTATLGVSTGVVAGYGTPDFRAALSLAWGETRGLDRDGDGILDASDKCPDDPEDFDSFEDEDGCPDPDNDKDGIPDVKDKCPNVPENFNGVQDEDGCPEVDTDGDGIYDHLDRCPLEPEDKDGFEDTDGCPDLDNDQDGILDVKDKCPNDKETVNGILDEDGCPEFDRDGDGINDNEDQCPDVPEDKDGDQDWDGCPEETLGDYIKLEPIYFFVDSDRIRPISFPTLNKVAGVLDKAKQLCVDIQGHTSLEGADDYNLALSDKRAKAVQTYLITKGIADSRLDSKGFGEQHPAIDEVEAEKQGKEVLEDAREGNRRIEFVIIDCQTRKPKGR